MDNTLSIARTIQSQLVGLGQVKVWSWGANKWTAYKDEEGRSGLEFKVSGFKFKGYVRIILDWSDTYIISFTNIRKSLKGKVDGVFFDEMVDLIDDFVEYPGTDDEYKKLIEKHYKF
jgi:hypothetical protein